MTSGLCSVCESIFRGREIKREVGSASDHHVSLQTFRDGVHAGCFLCVLLAQAMTAQPGGLEHIRAVSSRRALFDYVCPAMLHIFMSWLDGDTQKEQHFLIGLLPLLFGERAIHMITQLCLSIISDYKR